DQRHETAETLPSPTLDTTDKRSWETTPGSPYQRGSDQRHETAETAPSPTLNTTDKRSWETTPESPYQRGSDQTAETRTDLKRNAMGTQNWEPAPLDQGNADRNNEWQASSPASSPDAKRSPAGSPKNTNNANYRPGSLDSNRRYQQSKNSATTSTPEPFLNNDRQPYMTHSRRFQLDYDIDAIAFANISQVELWATTDQGRRWQKWGHDEDRQSPLEVEVNDPGTYGFRIVIVGRNGVAGNTPSPGAEADVWVTVDQTPPEVKLLAVQTGKGAQAGHLVIHWDASDRHLSERPVTLRVAESANGPWTIIAEGLQNVSKYAWRPPATIARQIHVQIEARDAAGNHAMDQTRSPVDVRSATPRGRIRGFRSLQEQRSQNASKSVNYQEPTPFGVGAPETN
ncbi:MAG: hypothetical protein CMJ75_20815, partial [Planctomycetaceae bacterium]|nr:hypothetical protein [Planctomycetaceae bacterium]